MYIFYPVIIVLGILTSYTDIRFGIIRNKHLLFFIIIGLATYSYLFIIHHHSFSDGYRWILNLFLGMGIALLLYFTNVWSAGDAKLFAVFCLLMPTQKYSDIFPFASIVLFFNTFILGAVVVSLSSINRIVTSKTQIFHKIFSIESLKELGDSFYVIVCLAWISSFIVHRFMPEITGILRFLILYVSYHTINSAMHNYVKSRVVACVVYGLGILARFYIQPWYFTGASILHYIKITLCYTFSFHCLYTILASDNKDKENLPFAPILFLGTLLSNTNFLNTVMNLLMILRS